MVTLIIQPSCLSLINLDGAGSLLGVLNPETIVRKWLKDGKST